MVCKGELKDVICEVAWSFNFHFSYLWIWGKDTYILWVTFLGIFVGWEMLEMKVSVVEGCWVERCYLVMNKVKTEKKNVMVILVMSMVKKKRGVLLGMDIYVFLWYSPFIFRELDIGEKDLFSISPFSFSWDAERDENGLFFYSEFDVREFWKMLLWRDKKVLLRKKKMRLNKECWGWWWWWREPCGRWKKSYGVV